MAYQGYQPTTQADAIAKYDVAKAVEEERKKQEEAQKRNDFLLPGYDERAAQAQAYALNRGGGVFQKPQQDLASLLMRQAQGQDSYSAEQLRQSTGRLMGQQQAFAAGARPSQSAMAARLASQNSSRLGSEMAGQQALAGIAERTSAANAAGNVIGQGRQQDIGATLGFMDLGLRNAGMQQGGLVAMHGQQAQVDAANAGKPSDWAATMNTLGGLGGAAASIFSDVRLKKDVKPYGEAKQIMGGTRRSLDQFLDTAARPYDYEYKGGKGLPGGQRSGPMAQNIEKVAPDAVKNTPDGKVVEYGKLVPALMAGLGRVNQKVAEVAAGKTIDPMRQPEYETPDGVYRDSMVELAPDERRRRREIELAKRANVTGARAGQEAGANIARNTLDSMGPQVTMGTPVRVGPGFDDELVRRILLQSKR